MEGREEGPALVSLAERGTAMRRWPRVTHCCRGLGRAPPPQLSGGTVLARRGRPGAPRVTVALRRAARTVHQAPTALGACYQRRRSRWGAPNALTATAHTRARLVYSLLKPGSAAVPQGSEA
jgi:hypothetical protein